MTTETHEITTEAAGVRAEPSGSRGRWRRTLRRWRPTLVRLRPALPPTLYLLFFFVVFRRIFLPEALGGERGAVFGWDVLRVYWPELGYRFQCLWRGEWPLWNPYELSSGPFAARAQTMLYYPPAWLTLPFALPDGQLPLYGAECFVAWHGALGAWGVHRLTRRLGAGEAMAYFAGVTAMLGGPSLTHVDSAVYYGIQWLPWLLAAIDDFVTTPGRRTALSLTSFGFLAAASGTPPGVFYVLVAALLFAGPRALAALVSHRAPRWAWLRHLARLVGWGSLVALFAAGTLALVYVPSLHLLPEATRQYGSTGYVLYRALGTEHLASLLRSDWPYAWWFNLFIGLLPLMTALPALLRPPRLLPALLLGISLVSIGLALGREGGLLLPAAEHLPGFNMHRLAYRYTAIFGLLWPPVAARGLGIIAELALGGARGWRQKAQNAQKVLAATLILGAAWLMWVMAAPLPPRAPHDTELAARLFPWELGATTALLCALLLLPERWPRRALVPLLMLGSIALDLSHLWWAAGYRIGVTMKFQYDYEASAQQWVGADALRWRAWYYTFGGTTGSGTRLRLRYADSYPDPLGVRRANDLHDWLRARPERAGLLGAKYLFAERHANFSLFALRVSQHRWLHRWPVPRLAWYGAVERCLGRDALDRWERSERRGVAVVETTDWHEQLDPLLRAHGERVAGTLEEVDNHTLRATVDAPRAGLVVLNEVYARGWSVEVDGRPARLTRANFLLSGVPVPAGRHQLLYRYLPPEYPTLVPVFCATLVAIGALAVWPKLVRLAGALRRAPAPRQSESEVSAR